MAKQLHKRFSDQEIKMLLEKYISEKIELSYLLGILGIKRRRFFELVKEDSLRIRKFLSKLTPTAISRIKSTRNITRKCLFPPLSSGPKEKDFVFLPTNLNSSKQTS